MSNAEDYLEYIRSIGIEVITEPLDVKIEEPVLNTDQDWDEIAYVYSKKQVVIVDDFLKPEYAERLRRFKLAVNVYNHYHRDGYFDIDYAYEGFMLPIIDRLVQDCQEYISIYRDLNFIRGWSFLHDYNCRGVQVHSDYNDRNLNFWVTPNECVNDIEGFNGLTIYKIKPPEDWEHTQFNGEPEMCEKYIKESGCERIDVPYAFNRAMFFESKFFHTTQPVSTKPFWDCKRINYTLLWDNRTYDEILSSL